MQPSTSRPFFLIALVGMLALIAAAYWPALSGGFIFDDYPIFAENPATHITGWHLGDWISIWQWSLNNIQRPLAMLTYALNYALGGSTFGFKLTNLLIHLLNALLVLTLTRRLLGAAWALRENDDSNAQRKLVDYGALAVAFAWAVHPLQVSTVMYVVQRMEMLGFMFTLLALLTYWKARTCQRSGQRAWPWLLLFGALTATGYFAKETAILVPGYTLLIELTLLHFSAANPNVSRAWKAFYVIGCAAALSFLLFHLIPHVAQPINYVSRNFTASQRELTQLRVLPMYLYWILAPLPSHFLFYYDNYAASLDLFHPLSTLLGAFVLAGLAFAAIAARYRRPLLALGIGWFFVAHILTSSPIPLELVFEHRNYPALLGVLLAFADLLRLMLARADVRVAPLLAAVLIANLCLFTFIRASIWSSPFQLSVALADANPGSSRAALDLARRYMAMSGGNPDSPLYSMSLKELQRAAALPTSSALPEESLLLVAADRPDMPAQPWWDSLTHKLRTGPLMGDNYAALNKLMTQRLGGKTGIDARQLANAYAVAIERAPTREMLHAEYAELAGGALDDPDLAVQQWQAALRLEKDLPGYAKQLASYLASSRRDKESSAVIEYAIALQPSLRDDPQLLTIQAEVRSRGTTEARPAL